MGDEPARPNHLRVITGDGEVAGDLCPHCYETDMAMRTLRAQNTQLRNQWSRHEAARAKDGEIIEVLEFWRDTLAPRAGVVQGSANWTAVAKRLQDVDATTGERRFDVLRLKAAVIGISHDPYCMAKGETYRRHPATAFNDPDRVGRFVERARDFWRETGENPLGIMEELGATALRWLAERCSCGHTCISHLMGGPRPDATRPCTQCDCQDMDDFTAKVNRYMRELEAE